MSELNQVKSEAAIFGLSRVNRSAVAYRFGDGRTRFGLSKAGFTLAVSYGHAPIAIGEHIKETFSADENIQPSLYLDFANADSVDALIKTLSELKKGFL